MKRRVRRLVRALATGCAVLSGAVFGLAGPAERARAAEQVDLELVLAVDISGSIDPEEARLQREGYIAALLHPDVLRAIQDGYNGSIAVTYLEWADAAAQTVLVDWAVIRTVRDAQAFAEALAGAPLSIGRRTSISGAIGFAVPLFAANGITSIRRVIDISGDGENNSGLAVTAARDAAVAQGITINGLPIVNDRPNRFGFAQLPNLDRYYANCVIGGAGSFLVVANSFADFAEAVRRKLILEIAGDPAPRAPQRAARPLLHFAQAAPGEGGATGSDYDCMVGERRWYQYYQRRGLQ